MNSQQLTTYIQTQNILLTDTINTVNLMATDMAISMTIEKIIEYAKEDSFNFKDFFTRDNLMKIAKADMMKGDEKKEIPTTESNKETDIEEEDEEKDTETIENKLYIEKIFKKWSKRDLKVSKVLKALGDSKTKRSREELIKLFKTCGYSSNNKGVATLRLFTNWSEPKKQNYGKLLVFKNDEYYLRPIWDDVYNRYFETTENMHCIQKRFKKWGETDNNSKISIFIKKLGNSKKVRTKMEFMELIAKSGFQQYFFMDFASWDTKDHATYGKIVHIDDDKYFLRPVFDDLYKKYFKK